MPRSLQRSRIDKVKAIEPFAKLTATNEPERLRVTTSSKRSLTQHVGAQGYRLHGKGHGRQMRATLQNGDPKKEYLDMRVIVFFGPEISKEAILEILPDATVLAPTKGFLFPRLGMRAEQLTISCNC